MIKTETYTAILDNVNRDAGTLTEATFNLNFPNKRASGYDKITLYVDTYSMNSTPLTNPFLNLNGTFYQENSISSQTKGRTELLAIVPNQIDRQSGSNDILSNNVFYQGSTTPIQITNIPNSITLFVTTNSGVIVNLVSNANNYYVRLRFECEYTEYKSMDM